MARSGEAGLVSHVPPAPPIPAATVVILRPSADPDATEPEVLLVQRPASMAFAPGLHAFPGGRVDPEDALPLAADRAGATPDRTAAEAADVLGGNVSPPEALALHHAALREVDEEIGVRLGGTSVLAPIALWTTPRFMPRRFATWFFVADLPPGAEPRFAPDEVAGHAWLTPTAALDALGRGRIEMWVPTTCVLERLVEIGAREARDVARGVRFGRHLAPRIVDASRDVVRLRSAGGGGLPGRTCETLLIGRRDVVVVDPGDPSEASIAAVEAGAARRGGTIRAVVLTSPDPDHAAGAEAIAIPHDVPVLTAPGAGHHLPYAVREVADAERLPADVPVTVRLGPVGSGRLEVVCS
jgi:8-oxo-dGTP pyrophosphatase MutT (NUDIX family)